MQHKRRVYQSHTVHLVCSEKNASAFAGVHGASGVVLRCLSGFGRRSARGKRCRRGRWQARWRSARTSNGHALAKARRAHDHGRSRGLVVAPPRGPHHARDLPSQDIAHPRPRAGRSGSRPGYGRTSPSMMQFERACLATATHGPRRDGRERANLAASTSCELIGGTSGHRRPFPRDRVHARQRAAHRPAPRACSFTRIAGDAAIARTSGPAAESGAVSRGRRGHAAARG